MHNGKKYVTLGVKLEESVAAAFQHWSKQNKMTTSQALLYMIGCVMKAQRSESVHNEKLQQVMKIWDNFRDMDSVSRVISPSAELEVTCSIYMVSEKGKRGSWPVLVEPSFFGEANYSTSIDDILDTLFATSLPGLNRALAEASHDIDSNGIQDTISALLTYYNVHEDHIAHDVAEMFQDNDRHEYGRSTELIKYRRHNHLTVDQLSLRFDNEQGQEIQQGDTELEVGETGTDPED